MENPSGTVVSLQEYEGVLRATIEVDIAEYCPRCAAGKGCGAGLPGFGGRARQIEIDVRPGFEPSVGESVRLSVAPAMLLRATFLTYGMPLLGALLGAGVAHFLRTGDGIAAALSLAGLAAGAAAGRQRLAARRCLGQFTPTMERQS